MKPSAELVALLALQNPPGGDGRDKPGDLWLQPHIGVVICFTGHKRGQRKRGRLTSFTLYHWRTPDLVARPADWRDNDLNAHGWDPHNPVPGYGVVGGGESWLYVGNIFVLLPYEHLAALAR